MLAIRLPEAIETRLDALAKSTGRSKSFYVREALLTHLDAIEDLYLAEQRLTEERAGHTRPIPIDDILSDYALSRNALAD